MKLNFLKGYIYSAVNVPTMKNDLLQAGVGAFAFGEIEKPAKDSQGKPRTMSWALHHAAGNKYLAERMLVTTSKNHIGCAFVIPGGIIQRMILDCREISQFAKSLIDLTSAMVENGYPIDPKKLCAPYSAYMSYGF